MPDAPNICVIALDETEFWEIPPEWRPFIERIEGVYVFDRNLEVHLAEWTGSYELWSLESRAVLHDDLTDEGVTDDDRREAIDEWIQNNVDRSEPVTYMHVDNVEQIIENLLKSGERFRFRSFGDGLSDKIGWGVVDQDIYDELGAYGEWTGNQRGRFMDVVFEEFARNSPI